MSLARDGISPDAIRAVAELAQLGRGSLEKRARDLAKLLAERDTTIAALEDLLTRLDAVAEDPGLHAYDVAKAVRGILRERER